MSAAHCSYQEVCKHFTNGTKRKVHHIRISDPCRHWLALDCEKITLLAELQEFATGDIMACSIEKRDRLIEKFKDTLGG